MKKAWIMKKEVLEKDSDTFNAYTGNISWKLLSLFLLFIKWCLLFPVSFFVLNTCNIWGILHKFSVTWNIITWSDPGRNLFTSCAATNENTIFCDQVWKNIQRTKFNKFSISHRIFNDIFFYFKFKKKKVN